MNIDDILYSKIETVETTIPPIPPPHIEPPRVKLALSAHMSAEPKLAPEADISAMQIQQAIQAQQFNQLVQLQQARLANYQSGLNQQFGLNQSSLNQSSLNQSSLNPFYQNLHQQWNTVASAPTYAPLAQASASPWPPFGSSSGGHSE